MGQIITGSPNVKVNGIPVGRVGDATLDSSSVSVGGTITGAPGSAASVENIANNGSPPVLVFTIPAGVQGPQGIQGPEGPAGANGASTPQYVDGGSFTDTYIDSPYAVDGGTF